MKIRCIANTGRSLPDSYLNPRLGYTKELEFPLTIGKDYIVYAFSTKQEQIWYYVCEDNYMYYPMRSPAPLFEVVDNRMSAYWRLKISLNGLLEVAFDQWFSDPYFYDKLTDQEEEEVLIFEKVKEMMDLEAFSPAHMLIDYTRMQASSLAS
ncbi:hypothetical protein [Limnofasciculus baicalensis]|uniref:Uncharacterized protein n=1 Tax=Limnofasciculus baicalensis BBK-W-15 TaxID=2699891 RepID=A0AAE3GLT3_9CYAN|nr:hypothetical protein [Limnofasciculus baicalensis]MCP2726920.1 hypothetical protein [Limnofasciculus baicalensis BBK-W-15]